MSSSEIIELVDHIVWPFTVLLILFVLRHEFKAILLGLRDRVADPHTSVKLTREGLELSSRVDALEGSAETQQLKADVLASAVPSAPTGSKIIPQTLLDLRASYLAVDEPDHMRRIQIKNELARSMGAEVLKANVNRRLITDQRDEILTLALAAAVTALPQTGDDELILAAGGGISRLHIRYRIAAAISELAQSHNLQPKLVPDMESLLSSYRKSADDRLLRRIKWTLITLRKYIGDKSYE
jgi:hypothetical protein